MPQGRRPHPNKPPVRVLRRDEGQPEEVAGEGDGEYVAQLKAVAVADVVPSAGFPPINFHRTSHST